MKKLTIIKLSSLILLAFIFNACSNGSCCNGDITDIDAEAIIKKIAVVSCDNSNGAVNDCGNSNNHEYYTCIKSGDSLIQDSDGTSVEIISSSNNRKKVCVRSGSTHILR